MHTSHQTSLIVIVVYLLLLVALGMAAKRMVSGSGDYFRSGSKGTWWLVGSSIFMGNFSAWTFTGAAAMAFDAGWAILAIYIFHPLTALLQAWLVAHRFRQLRATTVPEVIRLRFGVSTQQLYAVLQVGANFVLSAIALYGLSIFISAFFAIPVWVSVVVMGGVVLAYSTLGGSWAVMAADYVQSLLVVGMVAITAILSLWALGGIGGMVEKIEAANLTHAFRFLKEPGEFPLDKFTGQWVFALGVLYLFETVSLTNSVRYFTVKDGREARKAALFLVVLSILGVAFWFLPPIAGKLLFAEQIMAVPLDRPAEGAFAVTSLLLLPEGMAGLLAVAIIATTLSTLDVGLNRNAAIMVREIWPALCKVFGWRVPDEKRQLRIGRWTSLAAGIGIVLIALGYSTFKNLSVFDIMQVFTSLIALPITVPMAMALLVRRVPAWTALVSAGSGVLVAAVGLFYGTLLGKPWSFHFSTFAVVLTCVLAFFACRPFWKNVSVEYRAQVDRFFTRMETPVDFAAEVGAGNDAAQLKMLGRFTLVAAGLSALLLLTADSLRDVLLMLSFCGFLAVIGGSMLWAARCKPTVNADGKDAVSPPPSTPLN